jgi:glycosyltransferase involved in cell wall biosynthesis
VKISGYRACMTKTRLLVQGWRGLSHSYSMLNQYQLLELMRRPQIALFHQDMPFHRPQWSKEHSGAGFDPTTAALLDAIPPPGGRAADIAYRVAYPYRAHGGPEEKLFCQVTSEYRRLSDEAPFAMPPEGPKIDPRLQFITCSQWSKRGLENTRLGDNPIHLVPLGIDPAIFHPPAAGERDAMRQRLAIRPDNFVFLNLGAMTGNKGIDILLRAFAQVRRLHPEALLLLKDQRLLYGVAASQQIEMAKQSWPEEMASVTKGSVAVMPKNLDLATMAALYGACDAYVSPYRAEAFNLPPLEAAACGLPIVVTKGGSTDDYVHESFAVTVPARDATDGRLEFLEPDLGATVDAMLQVIERRARAIDPQKAVRWISENFTWKHTVDKLLSVFGVI